jgi:hypothetical protein
LGLHIRLAPDLIFETLRHHYDEGEAGVLQPDGMADADVGLDQAVGTALAGSVKEEDDGPGFLFGEIGRHKDLVTVGGGGDGDGAIEETGLSAGKGGERGCRIGGRAVLEVSV